MKIRCINDHYFNGNHNIKISNITLNKVYEVIPGSGPYISALILIKDDNNEETLIHERYFEEVTDDIYSPAYGEIVG